MTQCWYCRAKVNIHISCFSKFEIEISPDGPHQLQPHTAQLISLNELFQSFSGPFGRRNCSIILFI